MHAGEGYPFITTLWSAEVGMTVQTLPLSPLGFWDSLYGHEWQHEATHNVHVASLNYSHCHVVLFHPHPEVHKESPKLRKSMLRNFMTLKDLGMRLKRHNTAAHVYCLHLPISCNHDVSMLPWYQKVQIRSDDVESTSHMITNTAAAWACVKFEREDQELP